MNDTALHQQLEHGLHALQLDSAHAPTLLAYLQLLMRWNQTYNLTAIRDPAQMVALHLLDSLAMWPYLHGIVQLADLGSGAGLPGIPLAIVCPQLQVTLVESNGKKARFLREVQRTLQLPNISVAESRIETLQRPAAFDAITARALARLALLLDLGGHLLKPTGVLLAMKGAFPHDELDELAHSHPHWHLQQNWPLHVPGVDAERHLLRLQRLQTDTAQTAPQAG